ncbi:MAG TPA: PAS-domain containing protein [Stellaceae bacterium]|nr:PAS-domain containing protein [Stellaceae bacterium]
MIEFAAGICFVAAALCAALWWRAQARWHQATLARDAAEERRAGMAALLETLPLALFRWPRGDAPEIAQGSLPGGGTNLSYTGLLAGLESADAARLAAAVEALKRSGTAFATAVSAAGGTAYAIEGRRTPTGDSVIWLSDLSVLRRVEEERDIALSEAAELREIIDALPMPVWRRDAGLRIVDCNRAYAAALDLPREAVLAQALELAPENERERTLAIARAAAAGTLQRERCHVVIAGSRRLLELCEAPDRTPDTIGGGTVGVAIDRTDLESAEGELARHVNAHGQVLESIQAAVAIYGADKRLSFFNGAFARLWGLDEEWLSGEPSLDELLERLRERRRVPEYADFRAFKRQQLGMFTSLIEPYSELMHRPDGRTLNVSVSPHPLGGLIFVYEDVTDRLALERSYNTLIEVQRETLDNLFEGIAVYGSDGRLKLHNPAYRTIWGLTEADLASEPRVGDIVEKTRNFYEDGGDWPATLGRIIAEVTAQAPSSGPLDRRDGSVLQRATVLLPDGNVLSTYLDVTDTARVERALRERNEALETAGRLKSEFIANVSYELRTPLNAIIGFAEILANQYFGPLSPRQLDYSRGILDSSHQLMSLINDILDLATIEAGYLVLETGRIEVRDMLEAVMTLTRERARSQGLALTMSCPAGTGAIEADERRLKQALFNLISNAIKFTPAGGSIGLEARHDNGDLVLAVSDTGVGIPAADHERVFEKFERGNPYSRDSGAGLGLSLVKSLIEMHGGSVTITSEPGSGTTIVCRLPKKLCLPAAERAAAHPAV